MSANEENVFWTPLLEKAYAKFYGSYQALVSGTAIEAAVDFSGGIPEYIDISDLGLQYGEEDEEMDSKVSDIYCSLTRACSRDAFISCSMMVSYSNHIR